MAVWLVVERMPGDGTKEGVTLDVAHATSSRAQTIAGIKLQKLWDTKELGQTSLWCVSNQRYAEIMGRAQNENKAAGLNNQGFGSSQSPEMAVSKHTVVFFMNT